MTALLLIDIQNDFFPGGPLGVPHAEEILPVVNALLQMPFDVVVATQDWHPATHGSFADRHNQPPGTVINLHGVSQILWPRHCVQGTSGADFSPGWDRSKVTHVIHKGTDPGVDSYSAFFDNENNCSTGLALYLKQKGISTVVLAGLATDYCVKYSALDALKLGFKTIVVEDGCRGVNRESDDSAKALKEINAAGGAIVELDRVPSIAGLASS